jgi:hypothetical protein
VGKDDEEEESAAAARVGEADEDAFVVLLVVADVSASRDGSETLEPAGRIICSSWTTSSSNVGLLLGSICHEDIKRAKKNLTTDESSRKHYLD